MQKQSPETNLSICKDCGIVALKAAFDESLRAVLVDGFLLAVHVEHMVVGKGLVLSQDHLWLPGHHKGADVTALDFLFRQLRTDPGRQKETKTDRFKTRLSWGQKNPPLIFSSRRRGANPLMQS